MLCSQTHGGTQSSTRPVYCLTWQLTKTTAAALDAHLRDVVEGATQFGDVGRALPALYLLRHSRVAAFEGLTSVDQAVALAAEEMQGCAPGDPIAVIVEPRSA